MTTRYATIIKDNDGNEVVSAIAQMEGGAPDVRHGKAIKVADGVKIGMVKGGTVDKVGDWGFPAGTGPTLEAGDKAPGKREE